MGFKFIEKLLLKHIQYKSINIDKVKCLSRTKANAKVSKKPNILKQMYKECDCVSGAKCKII